MDSWIRVQSPDGETLYAHGQIAGFGDEPFKSFSIVGSEPTLDGNTLTHNHSIEGTGVFMITCKINRGNTIGITSDANIDEWGIFAPSGQINKDIFGSGAGNTAWIFVPGESPEYYYTGSGISLKESDGTPISSGDGTNPNAVDDVWTLDITSDAWTFKGYKTPFVLCNSLSAANNIQTGYGTCETDGLRFWSIGDKLLHGKIAERIAALSDLTDTRTIPLDPNNTWKTNPEKYGAFTATYRGIRALGGALNYIGLDSSQYTAGMSRVTHSATLTPWVIDNESSRGALFGFLAAWNDPGNPHYNDPYFKELAKITLFAEFRRIQGFKIVKPSRWLDKRDGMSPRLPIIGLNSDGSIVGSGFFNYEMNNISSEDMDAILPEMMTYLDNFASVPVSTTRNQDCHMIPCLIMMEKLWRIKYPDDTRLKDYCIHMCKKIANEKNTSSGAGSIYIKNSPLDEARGFDGSYSGIQNFFLSLAANITRGESDYQFILDQLENNYNYFSHFISGAKSPYTRGAYGRSNDSRTVMGALDEQYDGGKFKVEDIVPISRRFTVASGDYNSIAEDTPENRASIESVISSTNADLANGTVNADYNYSDDETKTLFSLAPVYFDVFSRIRNSNNGILDLETPLLPCEVNTQTTVITDKRTEGIPILTVNTPKYYCAFDAHTVYEEYFKTAFSRLSVPRPLDLNGGSYLAVTTGDEIGGVGIEFLYDKVSSKPAIVAKNFSVFVTHQPVVYVTNASGTESLRWAKPNTRIYTTSGNSITVTYKLYRADGNPAISISADGDFEASRTFTFNDESIEVSTTITRINDSENLIDDVGEVGTNIRIFEHIPIGTSENSVGTDGVTNRELFANGESSILDDDIVFSAQPVQVQSVEWFDSRERIRYAKIPMAVPINTGDSVTLTYTISFTPGTDPGPSEILISNITLIARDGVSVIENTRPTLSITYSPPDDNGGGVIV